MEYARVSIVQIARVTVKVTAMRVVAVIVGKQQIVWDKTTVKQDLTIMLAQVGRIAVGHVAGVGNIELPDNMFYKSAGLDLLPIYAL